MANVPPISSSSLRGAVDLSGLVNPRPARPAGGGAAGAQATDASFTETLELSKTVPVIVEFYGQGIEPVLAPLIASYNGAFAHVVVEAAANPQLSQAFQVQELPTVAAVIGGRPLQMYVGDYPEAEVRQILDQVLALAKEQGVTGTAPGAGAAAEPAEEPLPPHHQEAFDAISAGDYATAIKEYKKALGENPRDALATAGLAQVGLLQRLDGKSAEEIRAAAASDPAPLEATLALADLSLSMGLAEDALDLLLDVFAAQDADGKTLIRTRLLDYFEILGDDPLVTPARRRLTGLLF
ncbi:MAG TPA: tetratricopeptide repeat protein [Galbitalea sp.]